MTKTLQEQEDEQGYSVDENTYFHPASGLNGLIITASSSILALDKMLGKRITNTRPFTIPAKRKTPTVQNDYSQAPAKTQRPLQVHDLNISRPSEQIQQETYPGNCSKQSPATFARKVPRILPPRNPPAQPNNSSLRSRAAQQDNRLAYNHNSRFNQPPQHNQQSTQRRQQPTFPSYQARQASSSSNDFSILDNASTSSPSRIIPALPVESNWSKSILNELKRGVVSDQTLEELQSLDRPLPSHHGIEPTELKELEAANYGKLAALSGESITYKAIDSGNEYLLKNCTAPAEITLKVDAQVMLTKNLSPALVNGSRGVVSDFRLYDDGNLYPVVTFANGKELLITPYSFTYDYHGKIWAEFIHSMHHDYSFPL
ncbi:hypothetical protein MUCCIDRAFT_159157 [Mucor lusitanicus CBS 277.49]|uniref:DNA helicase Pif1-like 2B domain-containing protein n=1 Tax=Mucor lusitanicus CBS 277.49 TaxID=747725 RepID=A0A162R7D2_MUCCL|nr:hypothetical protein MUCCIDRAFT_159157 [Mucor lusitanicus CBS 277.49]